MHHALATAVVLLALATPARAEPDAYYAVQIKQFLVCDGEMAKGCEQFVSTAFKQALAIFRRAAKDGHTGAQNNLAMLYESGAGVALDRAAARRWYTLAAEAGEPMARYNLAMLLATAHILQQSNRPQYRDEDLATAYMWLSLAAKDGLESAIDGKSELANFLTPEQIEAGEQMLRARY